LRNFAYGDLAQGSKNDSCFEDLSLKVMFYSESVNDSSYRYRIQNFSRSLEAFARVKSIVATRQHRDRFESLAKEASILVIHRSGVSSDVLRLIGLFRSLGKKVIFDTDDLVIHQDNVLEVIDALGLSMADYSVLDYWYAYVGRISAVLSMVDHVTVTTSQIAEFVEAKYELPTTVVRNFPSESQFAMSIELEKNKAKRTNGPIKLGYFSGSPSHSRDFALIEEPLSEFLRSSDAELYLVGYLESETISRNFRRRVKHHSFVASDKLIGLIAAVDLNLAPLRKSRFTDSKSALKLFDAALAGTYSLASPSREYLDFNSKVEVASFADDESWFSKLESFANNEIPCLSSSAIRLKIGDLVKSETANLNSLIHSIAS
jgi:hypothetical protein